MGSTIRPWVSKLSLGVSRMTKKLPIHEPELIIGDLKFTRHALNRGIKRIGYKGKQLENFLATAINDGVRNKDGIEYKYLQLIIVDNYVITLY